MQITIGWTCRECGQDSAIRTDTADYGAIEQAMVEENVSTGPVVTVPHVAPLACHHCAHVSGELGLGYRYRGEHRPSWAKARGRIEGQRS